MKKNFFKVLLAGVAIMMAFTSCLDDGDGGSMSADNTFAYVSSVNSGTQFVAYSPYGMIPLWIAGQSDGLRAGDCAFVSYKYKNENWASEYYAADYINVNEERIFRKEDQTNAGLGSFNTEGLDDNKNYFLKIPTSGSANSLIILGEGGGDRWYFAYSYPKRESDQDAKLLLTFDPEKHVTNTNGEVIIDFQLQKQGSEGEGDIKTASVATVIDFTELKLILRQYRDSEDMLKVKFRYYAEDSSATGDEPKYKLYTTSSYVVQYSFKETE